MNNWTNQKVKQRIYIKEYIDLETGESRYMGVLISERERCERLYHDNPKEWEDRKYLNRLKKQRQWTESKATMVAEKERRKEENSTYQSITETNYLQKKNVKNYSWIKSKKELYAY